MFKDGMIAVLDNGPRRVVLIHSIKDSVVARFATVGSGPGEIAAQAPILVPRNDGTLYVELWGNRRAHQFDRNGTLLRDVPVSRFAGWPAGPGGHDGEITVHVWTAAGSAPAGLPVDSLAHLDLVSGTIRPFAPLPPRVAFRARQQPTFHPLHIWSAFASGEVVTGMSDSGNFHVYSKEGMLVRAIRLPMRPRAVSEDSRRAASEYANDLGYIFPAEGPFHSHHRMALRLVTIRDGIFGMVHSWLSSTAEDSYLAKGAIAWRLFSIRGDPAGIIRFPMGFTPYQVKDSLIIGATRDSMGLQTIRVFRLSEPQKEI